MSLQLVIDIIMGIGLIPYTAFVIWYARDVQKYSRAVKKQKEEGEAQRRELEKGKSI